MASLRLRVQRYAFSYAHTPDDMPDKEVLSYITDPLVEELHKWEDRETLHYFLSKNVWPCDVRTLFWNSGTLFKYCESLTPHRLDFHGIHILRDSILHGAEKDRMAISLADCLEDAELSRLGNFPLLCELLCELVTDAAASDIILNDKMCESLAEQMRKGDAEIQGVLSVFLEAETLSYRKCHFVALMAAHALITDFTRVPHIEKYPHLKACLRFLEHLAVCAEWHTLLSDWVLSLSRYGWPPFLGTLLLHMLSTTSVAFLIALHNGDKLDLLIRRAHEHAETMACHVRNGDSEIQRSFAPWTTVQGRLRFLWPARFSEVLGVPSHGDTAPTTNYECPITLQRCVHPVVASDGHTYERDALLEYIAAHKVPLSPMTKAPLSFHVYENFALRIR